jgi:hypothetical protein
MRGLGSTGYVAGGQAWLAIANGFLKDNFLWFKSLSTNSVVLLFTTHFWFWIVYN